MASEDKYRTIETLDPAADNDERSEPMKVFEPRVLLDAEEIARALRRMAGEITERNHGAHEVSLVGVRRGGVPLAYRLRALLRELEGLDVPVGSVDITLYRDDAATALPNPRIGRSDIHFPIEDGVVVLVDDVLFTGRTTRAAIDALMDYGRPRAIQLAALIDRGHRELPIQPDYCGRAIETSRSERVDVLLDCEDGQPDRALISALTESDERINGGAAEDGGLA